MKSTYKITILACFVLSACSEQTEVQLEKQTASVQKATQQENKPNRFYEAAVNKIKNTIQGASVEQAKCMLDAIVADGRIGIGEINQMKVNEDGSVKRASLDKALTHAKSECM